MQTNLKITIKLWSSNLDPLRECPFNIWNGGGGGGGRGLLKKFQENTKYCKSHLEYTAVLIPSSLSKIKWAIHVHVPYSKREQHPEEQILLVHVKQKIGNTRW